MDTGKLISIFMEEAKEHVLHLEKGLSAIATLPSDQEALPPMRRAIRAITGSSESIGLTEICRFGHAIEEVLDLLGGDRLSPRKEVIALLFDAVSLLKTMISSAPRDETDSAQKETLMERMKDLKNRDAEKQFRLTFVSDPDFTKRRINPSSVLEALRQMGTILDIKASSAVLPEGHADAHDALRLRWDIVLKTDREAEDIGRAFGVADEKDELRILPMTASDKEIPYLGRMLIDEGVVKHDDIAVALRSQKKLGEILIDQGKATADEIEKVLEKQRRRKIESFRSSLSSSVSVDLRKLDRLIEVVNEIVMIHSLFQRTIETYCLADGTPDTMEADSSQLRRIERKLKESAASLRMLPVADVFRRFTKLAKELSESRNKSVELTVSGGETEIDKDMLEEIADPLIHLIRNAVDHAIESPEERTAKGKSPHGKINLAVYRTGGSVCVEVEDDGRGFRKALSTGAAVPPGEFSEEEAYRLLLAPVNEMVGRRGGKTSIYSEEGKGTIIKLYFPDLEAGVQHHKIALSVPDAACGATVLVVEDDDLIRQLVIEILNQNGYRVLDARNGGEALEICESRGREIDLILTDVVMPQMSGRELVEQLKGRGKDFKVLYMSAYSNDIISHQGILENGIHFIGKPFGRRDLLQKVAQVMRG